LDVYSGYNQIRLRVEDEEKTSFTTPNGVFCYQTMPFGLKNAGATYQRMMQKCLANQIRKNVQVYIDDVVITTKRGETLIEDLREVFDSLDKYQIKLNPTKCSFGVPAGQLLGYLVSERGIEANPEKIQAIVTMKKPIKLLEVQQLTGKARRKCVTLLHPNEKSDKFEWSDDAAHGATMAKMNGAVLGNPKRKV
jgi:hypothetical protein